MSYSKELVSLGGGGIIEEINLIKNSGSKQDKEIFF